ncbi:MAG: glycosyltransferase family 39 protein [Anaerolineales bacterium]|nr:glycosyltransferase family 39 protein [Anaerolineales bacterium]
MNSQSKIENRKSTPKRAVQKREIQIVYFVLLILIIFVPRLINLDVFLTADEPLFLEHAQEFAEGLATGDLELTLGIGYPGVTVAWWAAPVVGLAQTELYAYVAGRVMTALVNSLLLLVLYALARKLLGRWPAFIGVSLLALDPFILGYSRLLHNEAPLTLFMTLAGLSFLLWLRAVLPLSSENSNQSPVISPQEAFGSSQKNVFITRPGGGADVLGGLQKGRPWLLLAGLFTGLALLTKSTALLLGPMLVALLIGWAMIGYVSRPAPHSSRLLQTVLTGLAGLVIAALVSSLVFYILWPAMWTRPQEALQLTFDKLLTDQEAGTGNFGMFWLGDFVEDPGPFFYPVAFLLRATPWLLLGLGLSFWQAISIYILPKKYAPRSPLDVSHSLPLWFFALTYMLVMTIASKKAVRYLLPAYPTFCLLAGLAFYEAGRRIGERRITTGILSRLSFLRLPYARLLLFVPLVLLAWFYHPYYLTYYNPAFLGWLWAPKTLLVGWGEGLDEAARYVSRQPPGMATAWYGQLFSAFYPGRLQTLKKSENLITSDYTVLYLNQVQRNIPNPNVIHYFRTRRQPEYTVHLAGIEYAWVYRGPVAGMRPDPVPHYPLGGDFGGEVRLLGYDLSQPQLSGQPLVVTLYWRVLAVPPSKRFVYVRLVDAQGRVWAKSDGPPVMGLWPISNWQPAMLVEDAQEVAVPPGTPPGTYRLEVGWYDPATGQTLAASGQPLGQGGGLLLGEIQLGWQSLPVEADLPHLTDQSLAPNARLVGYDSPPPAATTGDIFPLRLAWREAAPLWTFGAIPNNSVMFEWRQDGQRVAEQLDPLPLPIEKWGRRALLLSQHDVIVPPTLAAGRYELVVMLHTGSDPAGEAFALGMVEVTTPAHQFELPPSASPPAAPAHLEQGVALAGYEFRPGAQKLDLTLYWQTQTPLTTRYKVFAQLLTADNSLVAQSDSFPAAGQRPTTGWLPGEIIADPHSLAFPTPVAPGTYRLIAGLYNPLNGQRVPVLNESGEAVLDAILITEVTLP